jgi:hypothetical protein
LPYRRRILAVSDRATDARAYLLRPLLVCKRSNLPSQARDLVRAPLASSSTGAVSEAAGLADQCAAGFSLGGPDDSGGDGVAAENFIVFVIGCGGSSLSGGTEAIRPRASMLTGAASVDPAVGAFSETPQAAAAPKRSKAQSRRPTLRRRQDGDGTGSSAPILGGFALGAKGGLSLVASIWVLTISQSAVRFSVEPSD